MAKVKANVSVFRVKPKHKLGKHTKSANKHKSSKPYNRQGR